MREQTAVNSSCFLPSPPAATAHPKAHFFLPIRCTKRSLYFFSLVVCYVFLFSGARGKSGSRSQHARATPHRHLATVIFLARCGWVGSCQKRTHAVIRRRTILVFLQPVYQCYSSETNQQTCGLSLKISKIYSLLSKSVFWNLAQCIVCGTWFVNSNVYIIFWCENKN